ncbi:hypothetical protein TWF730_007283 [Orbilia blumenaviensis]|uniref:Uncharacterized protein n=1 Tax=Orbilia blumenaviensis TaxID=1796055 RepID=A0AAV9V9W2_9PEZI
MHRKWSVPMSYFTLGASGTQYNRLHILNTRSIYFNCRREAPVTRRLHQYKRHSFAVDEDIYEFARLRSWTSEYRPKAYSDIFSSAIHTPKRRKRAIHI